MATMPKRRLGGGYDSSLLGTQDPQKAPGRLAPPNPGANLPSPMEPMVPPDFQDPMAPMNPMNDERWLGIQRRRLAQGF
ncbi:MAG TPA: hypothetical protein VEI97_20165 [bacterium]|nr:hypothetical protein [bacterium]